MGENETLRFILLHMVQSIACVMLIVIPESEFDFYLITRCLDNNVCIKRMRTYYAYGLPYPGPQPNRFVANNITKAMKDSDILGWNVTLMQHDVQNHESSQYLQVIM